MTMARQKYRHCAKQSLSLIITSVIMVQAICMLLSLFGLLLLISFTASASSASVAKSMKHQHKLEQKWTELIRNHTDSSRKEKTHLSLQKASGLYDATGTLPANVPREIASRSVIAMVVEGYDIFTDINEKYRSYLFNILCYWKHFHLKGVVYVMATNQTIFTQNKQQIQQFHSEIEVLPYPFALFWSIVAKKSNVIATDRGRADYEGDSPSFQHFGALVMLVPLLEILQNGFNFLYLDVDLAFLEDPIPYIINQQNLINHQLDVLFAPEIRTCSFPSLQYEMNNGNIHYPLSSTTSTAAPSAKGWAKQEPNTGTMFIMSNVKTIVWYRSFLENIVQANAMNDQRYMQLEGSYMVTVHDKKKMVVDKLYDDSGSGSSDNRQSNSSSRNKNRSGQASGRSHSNSSHRSLSSKTDKSPIDNQHYNNINNNNIKDRQEEVETAVVTEQRVLNSINHPLLQGHSKRFRSQHQQPADNNNSSSNSNNSSSEQQQQQPPQFTQHRIHLEWSKLCDENYASTSTSYDDSDDKDSSSYGMPSNSRSMPDYMKDADVTRVPKSSRSWLASPFVTAAAGAIRSQHRRQLEDSHSNNSNNHPNKHHHTHHHSRNSNSSSSSSSSSSQHSSYYGYGAPEKLRYCFLSEFYFHNGYMEMYCAKGRRSGVKSILYYYIMATMALPKPLKGVNRRSMHHLLTGGSLGDSRGRSNVSEEQEELIVTNLLTAKPSLPVLTTTSSTASSTAASATPNNITTAIAASIPSPPSPSSPPSPPVLPYINTLFNSSYFPHYVLLHVNYCGTKQRCFNDRGLWLYQAEYQQRQKNKHAASITIPHTCKAFNLLETSYARINWTETLTAAIREYSSQLWTLEQQAKQQQQQRQQQQQDDLLVKFPGASQAYLYRHHTLYPFYDLAAVTTNNFSIEGKYTVKTLHDRSFMLLPFGEVIYAKKSKEEQEQLEKNQPQNQPQQQQEKEKRIQAKNKLMNQLKKKNKPLTTN